MLTLKQIIDMNEDGAAAVIGFYGFACLFSTVKRRQHSIIYHIAKVIVAHEEREHDRKSA